MKFSEQGKNDKKQFYQVSFGVPLWLFRWYDSTRYFLKKWAYKLNPDKCDCCGKPKLDLSGKYEHVFENGKRLMVENHAYVQNKMLRVCRECLLDQLETGEWTPRFTAMSNELRHNARYNYRFWATKECAITGKKVRSYKDVEIDPYVNMTFCTIAWNHDYISKEAVIECVRDGTASHWRWGIYKGKMMQINHRGIFMDGGKIA